MMDTVKSGIEQTKGQIEQASSQLSNLQNEVNNAKEVDLAEVGMQVTDVIVSSGILEQFGTELGASAAVIAAIVGIYWKLRGKEPPSQEAPVDASEDEPNKSDNNDAEREVEKLKTIEQQQIENNSENK